MPNRWTRRRTLHEATTREKRTKHGPCPSQTTTTTTSPSNNQPVPRISLPTPPTHSPNQCNQSQRDSAECEIDDTNAPVDRSIFTSGIPAPPPIPTPRFILRHKLHRQAIERQRKPKFVCIRPQNTTTPVTSKDDTVKQSNDGHRQSDEHAYVPGVSTTNAGSNDDIRQTTPHKEKTLGTLYRELNKSGIEQPDDEDIPLLNWHIKLNHKPTKALQKISKHPKFRQLLNCIKRYKKLSCFGCADGKA